MLNFLIKTFYFDTTTYIVDVPKETIVQRLDTLFFERSGLFKSPNLSGQFVDYPDTFTMTPKWSPTYIRNFERRAAYLKGTITELNGGKTKIEIAVRPNSVFGMLFLPFAIFGIYNLIRAFTVEGNQSNLYGGLFILLIGLPIIIGIAKAMAGGLQSDFEKYLNIHSRAGGQTATNNEGFVTPNG